jgi:hypothetical protein
MSYFFEHPIAGRWTDAPESEVEIRPLADALSFTEKKADRAAKARGEYLPPGFAIPYSQMANVQLANKKEISFDALARFQKKRGLLKRKKETYVMAPTIHLTVDDEAEAGELYEMLCRAAKAEPEDYTA